MNDTQVQTLVFAIAGSIISLLLAILGVFFRRFIKQNDGQGEDIGEIKVILKESTTNFSNLKEQCHEKHGPNGYLEKKFDEHKCRLDNHDKDIYKLKARINDDKA